MKAAVATFIMERGKRDHGGSDMKTTERIFDFISKQKVAFIASVDAKGFPNMKAMLMPRKIEGSCFYFTTNTSSMRVTQYRENPKASIYFFNKGRFRYEGVMFIGTMEVLEDMETKKEIWRVGDTMFYKHHRALMVVCVVITALVPAATGFFVLFGRIRIA